MDGRRRQIRPHGRGLFASRNKYLCRRLTNSGKIALQKPRNLIPLKKPEMQGAKFSRNEAYLASAAWAGKLK